jgi:hypothetical protein
MAEWATASVRVSSAEHSAAELTSLLGREPTRSFERGSLMSPRNPRSARRTESLWFLKSELADDVPLEQHLEWALEVAESLRAPLAELPSGSADIFVGWQPPEGQRGLVLVHGFLERLAAAPVDLTFDLYSTTGEEPS